jgi:hypothetical protein
VTRPRHAQTSVVKKSAAAMPGQCAFRKESAEWSTLRTSGVTHV